MNLYPRGDVFLTELPGKVRIEPGSAVAKTQEDMNHHIRRGEAVRLSGQWFRVSSEVSRMPLVGRRCKMCSMPSRNPQPGTSDLRNGIHWKPLLRDTIMLILRSVFSVESPLTTVRSDVVSPLPCGFMTALCVKDGGKPDAANRGTAVCDHERRPEVKVRVASAPKRLLFSRFAGHSLGRYLGIVSYDTT